MTLKVIFLVTEDWYFWSHRLSLAKALKQKGLEVLIVTRVDKHGDRIIKEGFKLIPIRLMRRSKNIFRELITLLEIVKNPAAETAGRQSQNTNSGVFKVFSQIALSTSELRQRPQGVIAIKIYRREHPDIVHQVAIKPVLYGSWAAKFSGVPCVINALAGLGFTFISKGWKASFLRRLVMFAYSVAFSAKNAVEIFQNPEDLIQVVRNGWSTSRENAIG